jgi:hypothetical protein
MGKRYVSVGEVVSVKLPWSEVCMFMRVSDQVRPVKVLADGAQILNEDGSPFSSAVTHGEAGFYRDASGVYVVD